jgi:hypothetical protein
VPGSLGLLPSGPDPVGEWLVRHQPPEGHIGDWGGKCKGVGGLAAVPPSSFRKSRARTRNREGEIQIAKFGDQPGASGGPEASLRGDQSHCHRTHDAKEEPNFNTLNALVPLAFCVCGRRLASVQAVQASNEPHQQMRPWILAASDAKKFCSSNDL